MFYVYVLKSLTNGRLYTGHTEDLDRRLIEHNSGQTPSTRSKGPYRLVYSETYTSRSEAYCREMYLKTGRGREELEKLVQSNP